MSREERRCFTVIFSPLAEKSQFIPVIQGVSVKTRIMLTSRFLKNCFDWCILYKKLSNCVFHFLELFKHYEKKLTKNIRTTDILKIYTSI